jgi:hypothetical protein
MLSELEALSLVNSIENRASNRIETRTTGYLSTYFPAQKVDWNPTNLFQPPHSLLHHPAILFPAPLPAACKMRELSVTTQS